MVGVYVTEHEAVVPVPRRLQLVELKEPVPVDEKNTAPVGTLAPNPEVSVVVAVHNEFALTS